MSKKTHVILIFFVSILVLFSTAIIVFGCYSNKAEEIKPAEAKVLGISEHKIITPEHVLKSGRFDYLLNEDGNVVKRDENITQVLGVKTEKEQAPILIKEVPSQPKNTTRATLVIREAKTDL